MNCDGTNKTPQYMKEHNDIDNASSSISSLDIIKLASASKNVRTRGETLRSYREHRWRRLLLSILGGPCGEQNCRFIHQAYVCLWLEWNSTCASHWRVLAIQQETNHVQFFRCAYHHHAKEGALNDFLFFLSSSWIDIYIYIYCLIMRQLL